MVRFGQGNSHSLSSSSSQGLEGDPTNVLYMLESHIGMGMTGDGFLRCCSSWPAAWSRQHLIGQNCGWRGVSWVTSVLNSSSALSLGLWAMVTSVRMPLVCQTQVCVPQVCCTWSLPLRSGGGGAQPEGTACKASPACKTAS